MEDRQNSEYCLRIIATINKQYSYSKISNYFQWGTIIVFLAIATINYSHVLYPTYFGICLAFITTLLITIMNKCSQKYSKSAAILSDSRDKYILDGSELEFMEEYMLLDKTFIREDDKNWYEIDFNNTIDIVSCNMVRVNTTFELRNIGKIIRFYKCISIIYVFAFLIFASLAPYTIIVFFYLGYYLLDDIHNIYKKEKKIIEIIANIEAFENAGADSSYINSKISKLQSENRQINIHLPEISFKKYNNKLKGDIDG